MFHFPSFPPHTLCVQMWVTAHDDCRVSPFGNPRIKAWLTAPRGLSWPPTSFIGSWCQGIHRAPLKTWPQMLASTVQFSNNDQSPTLAALTHHSSRTGSTKATTMTAVPSGPNNVPDTPDSPPRSTPRRTVLAVNHRVCRIVNVPPMSNRARHSLASGYVLLRKEVIQPHLPVRLPCYDFVPIAGPTFDGSSPYGLGHRLRVLPTFVT
jgi:hypothetical protein